jgi:hypothetical protein
MTRHTYTDASAPVTTWDGCMRVPASWMRGSCVAPVPRVNDWSTGFVVGVLTTLGLGLATLWGVLWVTLRERQPHDAEPEFGDD